MPTTSLRVSGQYGTVGGKLAPVTGDQHDIRQLAATIEATHFLGQHFKLVAWRWKLLERRNACLETNNLVLLVKIYSIYLLQPILV
jgi:hypothetical protein